MVPSLTCVLLLAGATMGGPELPHRAPTYLYKMKVGADHAVRFVGAPYCTQEGDIVLFDDHNPWITKIYKLVGSGGPLHAAIVFTRPDGRHALLEAGPNFAMKVLVNEMHERLPEYKGQVLVRQLKTPLSAEQSKKLTEFCLAQEGKSYALGRLALQVTPFRVRGSLREQVFGKTTLDRDRWICSELVVAAATAAGILNERDHPANSFYPRDLAYDEQHDISPFYEPPALWHPRPRLDLAVPEN